VIKTLLKNIYFFFLKKLFPICYHSIGNACRVRLRVYLCQKFLRINGHVYWPTHFTSDIGNSKNILVGVGTMPGLSPGCYIQGTDKVIIGDYTQVGPNVGIISSNHKLTNYTETISNEIQIGDYCWIGMNSVIMPGVKLGDFTTVAAGSIVNKSFEEGHCLIAGSPAKLIKKVDESQCVRYKDDYEYIGYFKKSFFKKNKKDIVNDFS
jgi:acetyltransferase-like isoleucine patch superfamily enzyme